MERGNPRRTYARKQQYDRQRDAPEAIRVVVRADGRAKEPQHEHANAEYKGSGSKRVATTAPSIAPTSEPTKRCQETCHAAPSDDCVMTMVVIGAQYASGKR